MCNVREFELQIELLTSYKVRGPHRLGHGVAPQETVIFTVNFTSSLFVMQQFILTFQISVTKTGTVAEIDSLNYWHSKLRQEMRHVKREGDRRTSTKWFSWNCAADSWASQETTRSLRFFSKIILSHRLTCSRVCYYTLYNSPFPCYDWDISLQPQFIFVLNISWIKYISKR
jgi:hypothetical protein